MRPEHPHDCRYAATTVARLLATYQAHRFLVPETYIGWSVWVVNYFDHDVEITAAKTLMGRYDL